MKAGYVKRGFAVAILLVCVVALPGQAGALLPTITVSNATATEGGAGAEFTVTLSEAAAGDLVLDWSASPNTEVSPSSGTATVLDGQTQATFTINAIDDGLDEDNENFTVTVSHAEGSASGQGTVVDNDAPPSVQIGDVTVSEGNSGTVSAVFNVQLSAPSGKPITVHYSTADGTAAAPADFAAAQNQPVPIAPGVSNRTITVAVNGDVAVEGNEHFFVNLTSAENATLGDTQGRGDITDDDVPPSASINDVAVTEGNAGQVNATFTVTLSSPAPGPVQIRYSTLNGSATAPGDYAGASNVLLNIAAGQSSGQFAITVNGDTLPEGTGAPPSEEFFVDLISAVGATISSDSRGIGKINDDDPLPTLSVLGAEVRESEGSVNLDFKIRLSVSSGQRVAVTATTQDGGAVAPTDYQQRTQRFEWAPNTPAGELEKTFRVIVNGDTLDEPDETLTVTLTDPAGATIAVVSATGTILDNDERSMLSIGDVEANEGSAGASSTMTFKVTLSPASARAVAVGYATANGTATVGSDYTGAAGSLSFAPGETEKTVTVSVLGDDVNEANETLLVRLSGATGAKVSDDEGLGTIVDKNAPPSLSISDALASEGGGASFTVQLAGTTLLPVTVGFSTSDGSAREPGDYTARRGTLTFEPGERTKTLVVSVVDDALAETVETFSVTISDVVNGAITKSRGVATIEASDQVATSGNGLRPTTPPASPTLLPKMVLAPRTVNVTRTGLARLFLTCTKLSPIACRGSITLQTTGKPAVKLGSKTFLVAKGKKKTVGVKLSPRARKLLAKRPTLRARVVVLVKTGTKSLRVVPGVITLKAAPKSAKPTSAKKSTAPKDTPPNVTVRP